MNMTATPTLVLPAATMLATHIAATASPHTLAHKNNDLTNIIFGVFAVVLALIGVLIAWLQLRKVKRLPHEADLELVGVGPTQCIFDK